jgi:purine-nucleoside phosphorylase
MTKIGIILGSGFHYFSDELEHTKILHEDNTGVHLKKIKSGYICNKKIIIFEGRHHYYERKSLKKILLNLEKAKEFGIELMIITNAAGGINDKFNISDLMLITSHLNLLYRKIPVTRKLEYFDKDLINKVRELGKKNSIPLHNGVYCATPGPMYETRAEIKFFKYTGVDAVGMSTIPEIFYANKLGMKTIAISCITNLLSKVSDTITEHDDVILASEKAYPSFSKLTKAIISEF